MLRGRRLSPGSEANLLIVLLQLPSGGVRMQKRATINV
jgi:hypothetical protein